MALYTDKQRQAVIARAAQAVRHRASGKARFGAGGQQFALDVGGYCNRFIRQVFETALGMGAFTWSFGAARACQTLEKLQPYRVALSNRQPGDILGFAGDPGHIALYMGREFDPEKELIAENTSATRGWPRPPGTKVTSCESLAKRITGCYRLFPEIAAVAPAPKLLRGIDVSHHQSRIDWPAVYASGEAFAFVKATEGKGWVDPRYTENVTAARAAWLYVGSYHFFRPDRNATAQAQHFLRTCGQGLVGQLPPVLDVEVAGDMGKQELTDSVLRWQDIVAAATGQMPILYCNPDYLLHRLEPVVRRAPLWLAWYTDITPVLFDGYAWDYWQYTSAGTVPGVSGRVDRNVTTLDRADMETLLVREVTL